MHWTEIIWSSKYLLFWDQTIQIYDNLEGSPRNSTLFPIPSMYGKIYLLWMVDSYGLHVDKYHIPSDFPWFFFFQVDPPLPRTCLKKNLHHHRANQAGNMSKARSFGSVCSMCSDLFLEEGGGLDLGSTRLSSSLPVVVGVLFVLFCFEKFFVSRPKKFRGFPTEIMKFEPR